MRIGAEQNDEHIREIAMVYLTLGNTSLYRQLKEDKKKRTGESI